LLPGVLFILILNRL